MHELTIYRNSRNSRKSKKGKKVVLKVIECFEPPDEQTIQAALAEFPNDNPQYDISRKEFDPEDFDAHEEV